MKNFTIELITIFVFFVYSSILSAQVTLNADEPVGCATHTVNFTVDAENAFEYYFDFYGWTNSNTVSFSYYYSGEFVEYVNVYDSEYNFIGSDTIIITVIEIPDYLNLSADNACPGVEIDFYLTHEGTTYSWDFGDGATSTEIAPAHAYTNTGSYTVSVTASNQCGSNTLNRDIYISSDLSNDGYYFLNVFPQETCLGNEITAELSGYSYYSDIINYEVDFGDGTVYENENWVEHSYSTNGEYVVTATFTNSCNKDTVLKDTVNISDNPPFSGSPYLYSSPDEACTNKDFYFYTYFNTESYLWEYDDGTTGQNNSSDYHSFSTEGIHYVTLTVTDKCGVDSSVVDSVVVNNNVPFQGNPSISLSPELGCPAEQFYFYAYGGFSSYLWDFGDGTTDTNNYEYHQYSSVGNYIVTLTVTDACGNDSTIKDTVTVTNDVPFSGNPNIYLTPDLGCPGTVFSMSANSGFESYHWNFGDGNSNADRSADHVYNAPGKYQITLTVTDECGNDSSIVDTVEVRDDLPFQGSPYLTINPNPVCPNTDVNYWISSGYSSYAWSFGNGETSDISVGQVQYDTTGDYVVMVTITDECGNDTVLYDTIYVRDNLPIPYADYDINKHLVCPLEDIYFNSYGTGIVSTLWEFGDINISKLRNTNHRYYKVGEYPVTLTMKNGCGSDTVFKDTIKVIDDKMISGSLSMSINNDNICPNGSISFSAYSNEDLDILWDFGDGNTSSSNYTSHSYTETGNYEVTLTFTNLCGKDTTLKDTVHVIDDLDITYVYTNHDGEACIGEEVSFYVGGTAIVDAHWVFEDGETYDGTNLTRSFDAIDTVEITITAYNACGDDTTITSYIVIRDGIEIDGYVNMDIPNYSCPGNEVWFTFYSYKSMDQILWDLGDGTTSNEKNPSHKYDTPGKYYITLRLTNACGDDTLITDSIEIIDDIGFSYFSPQASRSVICPGEDIYFYANTSGAVSYSWDLGDGTTAMSYSVGHTYTEVGEYEVSITVTNVCGGDSTKTIIIEVVDDMIIYEVDAGANKYRACPNEEIDFWASGNYATVEWDFGDETSSDESHVAHAYPDEGIYDVTVTVANYCGDEMTYYMAVYIESDISIRDFWFGFNDHVCPDQEFEFYADAGFASYSWDLGDGNTSTERNFHHSYPSAGSYDVTLTVTNECGNSASRTKTVIIESDLEVGRVFLQFPDEVCPNTKVNFNTSSGYAEYEWIINGETYNEREVMVTFASAGTYDVELTVTNFCGNSNTVTDEIIVSSDIPVDEVNFNIFPLMACPGDQISFEANDRYASASWDFGDGSTSTDLSTSHEYSAVGTYEVALTVTNGCGSSATATRTVEIGSDVAATLSNSHYGVQSDVCVGDPMFFYISPSGIGTYSIDFGDGSAAVTTTTPYVINEETYDIAEHVYNAAGTYDVTFVYTNACGNTFTDVVQAEVFSSAGNFDPDAWIDDELDDVDFCTETNIKFGASGGGNYVWDFGDGSDVVTEIASLSVVEHQYIVKDTYTVSVIISNSCGDSDTLTFDIDIVCGDDIDTNGTGPNNISLENINGLVSIYPNPTNDKLFINVPQIIAGNSEAIIFTLDGKTILRQSLNSTLEILNVSNIESGVYLLKINTDAGSLNKRILIQ